MAMAVANRDGRGVGPLCLIRMHHLATMPIGRPITTVNGVGQGITIRIRCRDVKRGRFAWIIQAGRYSGKTVIWGAWLAGGASGSVADASGEYAPSTPSEFKEVTT